MNAQTRTEIETTLDEAKKTEAQFWQDYQALEVEVKETIARLTKSRDQWHQVKQMVVGLEILLKQNL